MRQRIKGTRQVSCSGASMHYSPEGECRRALNRAEKNLKRCQEILDSIERKQFAREHKVVQIGKNTTVYLNENGMVEVTILGKVMELTVTEYEERYVSAFCK